MTKKNASAKQINFIKTLLDEKKIEADEHETITTHIGAWDEFAGDIILSTRQASAYIDRLIKLPRKQGAAPAQPKFPDVPAGTYALRDIAGEVSFFKVDRPERGKWAGYTFLSKMAGENHQPIKQHDLKREVLQTIANDITSAARLYGRLTSECTFCHMGLTDRFSRFYGVGPVCRDKHEMSKSEAAYRRDATPSELQELETFIAEDEGLDEAEQLAASHPGSHPDDFRGVDTAAEDAQANAEWLKHKIAFQQLEAQQEAAAFEAKLRRDEALFQQQV